MSPEYHSINNVEKDVRRELKEKMEEFGLSYDSLVHSGFGFNLNGKLNSIIPLSNLSESQKKDAKRENSTWHVVLGLAGEYSSEMPRNFKELHKRKYRGNHRSHTKGAGVRAYYKNITYNK